MVYFYYDDPKMMNSMVVSIEFLIYWKCKTRSILLIVRQLNDITGEQYNEANYGNGKSENDYEKWSSSSENDPSSSNTWENA